MKTLPLQSDYRVGCRTYIYKLVTACFVTMLFFGSAEIATAAIGYVNGSNVLASTANNTAGSPYTTSTYTPASDEHVLVIFVQGYNSLGADTASISSITWGGVSIAANQEAFQNATTRAWSAVYVITNPGTTAKAIEVAIGVDQRALQVDILEFSGVDTATPVVSTTQVGGTAISDTLDFTVSDAGNVIVGSFSVDGGLETPFTPDSGTIEVTDQATGGTNFNDNSVSSFYKITTGSGAQSIGTTWASSASYSGTGVELAASSGGGGGGPGGGGGGDGLVTLSGTLYEQDGVTAIANATVTAAIATSTTLTQSTTTNAFGRFDLQLPEYQASTTGWSTTSAAGDNDEWTGVTYGNGIFVAVASSSGSSDVVMTSPDGITWTARSAAGNDDEWTGVTYGNGLFVAVGSSGDRVMTSPDGITWTARSAAGDNDAWQSVTYGNGIFVAVGSNSGEDSIMTSPDGITWTARATPGIESVILLDVTYGNGLFVAVGFDVDGSGTLSFPVLTSPDGITWTGRTAAGDNDFWTGVTYGNGLFVAAGIPGVDFGLGLTDDAVMTSPDGITWTARSAAGDNDFWTGVTYGNGLFVAVACGDSSCDSTVGDRVMTSPDGITWTAYSAAGDNDAWQSVTYGNGRLVAVGASGDRVMYADFLEAFTTDTPITLFVDGATTTKATTLTYLNGSSTITGVDLWRNTVRLQHSSTTGAIDLTTADFYDASDNPDILIDVSGSTTTVGSSTRFADVRIEPGTTFTPTSNLVLYGDFVQNGSLRAENSTTSFFGSAPSVTGNLTGLDSMGNVFLNVVSDGTDWLPLNVLGSNDWWRSVTYGNSLFVAVGSSGDRVMTSPDGITWTARSAAGDNDAWQSVTYGNSLFVAVGSSGDRVMTSPDGVIWTAHSAAGDNDAWQGVTYGNGLFVAVACGSGTGCNATVGDRVMTSPDGVIWTAHSAAGDNDQWRSVTYGNGLFVAVGSSGDRVMTSPDGINWTVQSAAGNNDAWQSVTYGNGLFVAVSTESSTARDNVMTSPDGINWTVQSAAGDDDQWYGVVAGGSSYVAVGRGLSNLLDPVMTSSKGSIQIDVASTTGVSIATTSTLVTSGAFTAAESFSNAGAVQNSGELDLANVVTNSGTIINSGGVIFRGEVVSSGSIVSTGSTKFSSISSLTITGGTASLGTTTIDGTTTFVGDISTEDLLVSNGGTLTASDTTEVLGNLTITSGGNLNPGTILRIQGNIVQNGIVDFTETELQFVGSRGQIVSGDFTGGNALGDVQVNKIAGWTARSVLGDNDFWRSVTYGNGMFVAVGCGPNCFGTSAGDRVMTSPDGITWTARSAAGDNDAWGDVVYADGKFVAVASNGDDRVMYSSNGIDWTAAAAASSSYAWYGITHGDGLFVAVGQDPAITKAVIMTSPDGINWTERSVPGASESEFWSAVTYGNEVFVAVDGSFYGEFATSSDGVIWGVGYVMDYASDITYADGSFVLVGDGEFSIPIATSVDGSVWTYRPAAGSDDFWSSVVYGNNEYVAVGYGSFAGTNDYIITSPDGVTWTAETAPAGTVGWNGVAYGDGQYVAVGGSGNRVMTRGTIADPIILADPVSVDTLSISTTSALEAVSTLTVRGDFTNNGLFTALTSEVVFAGTSVQTATGTLSGTSAFNDLTIINTSQTGSTSQSVIFGAPLAVDGTFTMAPGTSAAFAAGATSTIQNIDLQGSLGDEIYLRSTAGGTAWGLDVPGSQISVAFVDVQDSHASTTITTNDSIDSGNNINWNFGEVVVGSSTITNHDSGRVSNAFNFQNKTNEPLYNFKLIPESGTATVTSLTLTLTGVEDIDVDDFSNIRLLRQITEDAEEQVGGAGVMSINPQTETGTIVFSSDFSISSANNYLVTANWNAPERGAVMNIQLLPSGVVVEDQNGQQEIFGTVSLVQHSRLESRGGGGGRASDIGGTSPEGDGIISGGGSGPGQQIGNDPNFRRPTAHSGSWTSGQNAYDQTDGTYATTNDSISTDWLNHNFGVAPGNTIQGVEVRLEVSGTTAAGTIDVQLSWDGGTSWTIAKTTPTLTTSDAVVILGGPSDLWGRSSWNVSNFSNANFLIRLTGAPSSNTIRLDEIQVRVYNQASGGGSGGGVDI